MLRASCFALHASCFMLRDSCLLLDVRLLCTAHALPQASHSDPPALPFPQSALSRPSAPPRARPRRPFPRYLTSSARLHRLCHLHRLSQPLSDPSSLFTPLLMDPPRGCLNPCHLPVFLASRTALSRVIIPTAPLSCVVTRFSCCCLFSYRHSSHHRQDGLIPPTTAEVPIAAVIVCSPSSCRSLIAVVAFTGAPVGPFGGR